MQTIYSTTIHEQNRIQFFNSIHGIKKTVAKTQEKQIKFLKTSFEHFCHTFGAGFFPVSVLISSSSNINTGSFGGVGNDGDGGPLTSGCSGEAVWPRPCPGAPVFPTVDLDFCRPPAAHWAFEPPSFSFGTGNSTEGGGGTGGSGPGTLSTYRSLFPLGQMVSTRPSGSIRCK